MTESVLSLTRLAQRIKNVRAFLVSYPINLVYAILPVEKKTFHLHFFKLKIKSVFLALACPSFFNGFSENIAGNSCEVYYDPETSQEFHTCKPSEFCYQHPKTKTAQGRYFGHCCPSPPKDASLGLVCPLSVSYNGTCPDTSDLPMDSIAPPDKIATCPFTTHDCVRQPLRLNTNVICYVIEF